MHRSRIKLPLLLVVVLAVLMPLVVVGTALAHVLESDHGVSAVLHIPPDDVPIAGRVTAIELAFAAKQASFDIQNYQIDVRLEQVGAGVTETRLLAVDNSSRNGEASLTFAKEGAYRLRVHGRSLDGKSSVFDLQYELRARAADKPDNALAGLSAAGYDFWVITIGSLIILSLIARQQIKLGGRYAASRSSAGK